MTISKNEILKKTEKKYPELIDYLKLEVILKELGIDCTCHHTNVYTPSITLNSNQNIVIEEASRKDYLGRKIFVGLQIFDNSAYSQKDSVRRQVNFDKEEVISKDKLVKKIKEVITKVTENEKQKQEEQKRSDAIFKTRLDFENYVYEIMKDSKYKGSVSADDVNRIKVYLPEDQMKKVLEFIKNLT